VSPFVFLCLTGSLRSVSSLLFSDTPPSNNQWEKRELSKADIEAAATKTGIRVFSIENFEEPMVPFHTDKVSRILFFLFLYVPLLVDNI